MKNTLVIMESPTKTKAVQHYLGKGYKVVSSEGHIRNLSTKGDLGLGVEIDSFTPHYKIERGKKTLVKNLMKDAQKADHVVLATDPDREGEAIAYHLNEVLGLKDKASRVRFNEITKEAILEAFDHQTEIDMNLVRAQETRRMLDRFIGFRLSKLLQKKIKSKSAGRVQSVALKLIVEREKENRNFVATEYWTVEGKYKRADVKLVKKNNHKIELRTEADVLRVKEDLSMQFDVAEVKTTERIRKSPNPHTTSTMLQEASSSLGFPSNKTSLLAQQLYEGIKVDKELRGFITYPRTDSIRLSERFVRDAYDYISINYGKDFIGEVKTGKASKKNVQDAHEAIRPTDLTMTPDLAKSYLTRDQWRLYRAIYNRALGSLMANAKLLGTSISLLNNGYEFRITGSSVLFEGFLKCIEVDDEDIVRLPKLQVGETIMMDQLDGIRHYTKPPARYSEAKLIKTLEDIGVGRPSTYAPIMRVLKERGYIVIENKALKATDKGILTSDTLQQWFKDIINEEYTSEVETNLDLISQGDIDNIPLLSDFWNKFEPRIQFALDNMLEVPIEKADIPCPQCGHDLVFRFGKFGKFIACSNFPKCRYIHQNGPTFGSCPECGVGEVILKFNKRHQRFKACSMFDETKCGYTDTYKEIVKDAQGRDVEIEPDKDLNEVLRISLLH